MHRRETLKARFLEDLPDYERYPDMEMPVTKINGRYYIERSDEISVNHEKKAYTKYCKFTGTVIEIDA